MWASDMGGWEAGRGPHCRPREWPSGYLPVLLAPLAPLEPLAQFACRGSVVLLRTSLTPIVPLASPSRLRAQARVRVRSCLRVRVCARACVCSACVCVRACAHAWVVCVPEALVQSVKLPAQVGSSGTGCQGPGARGPGACGPMYSLYPEKVHVFAFLLPPFPSALISTPHFH